MDSANRNVNNNGNNNNYYYYSYCVLSTYDSPVFSPLTFMKAPRRGSDDSYKETEVQRCLVSCLRHTAGNRPSGCGSVLSNHMRRSAAPCGALPCPFFMFSNTALGWEVGPWLIISPGHRGHSSEGSGREIQGRMWTVYGIKGQVTGSGRRVRPTSSPVERLRMAR